MTKALFLDRDGVINRDLSYVGEISRFEFLPGVFEALRMFTSSGYKLIVVTNQVGIAKAKFTLEQYHDELTNWYRDELLREGIKILDVYYCPHHPDAVIENYRKVCNSRKPKPGMLTRAIDNHNLSASESVMVGDRLSDLEAGRLAGIGTTILIPGLYEKQLGANPGSSSFSFQISFQLLSGLQRYLSERIGTEVLSRNCARTLMLSVSLDKGIVC